MNDPAPALLARWLEADASSPPPAGVDDEVVLAVQVLQPQRAPAPRLDLNALLASLRAGPLAAPGAAAAPQAAGGQAEGQLDPLDTFDEMSESDDLDDDLGDVTDEERAAATAFAAARWGRGEDALLAASAPPAPPAPALDLGALLGGLTEGPLSAPAAQTSAPPPELATPAAPPAGRPALRLLSGGGLKRWAPIFGALSIAAAALLVVAPLDEQASAPLRPTPTAGAPAPALDAAPAAAAPEAEVSAGEALPAGLPQPVLIAEAERSNRELAPAGGAAPRGPDEQRDPGAASAGDLARDEAGAGRSGGEWIAGGTAEGAGGAEGFATGGLRAPSAEAPTPTSAPLAQAAPPPPPAEPVQAADSPARADADDAPGGLGSLGRARYGQNEQLAEVQQRPAEEIVAVAKQAARKGVSRPGARPTPSAPPTGAAGTRAPAADLGISDAAEEDAAAPKATGARDEEAESSEKKKKEAANAAPPEGAALRAAHPELAPTWEGAARARARGDRAGLRRLLDPLLAHADPEVAAEAAIQLARDALRAGDPALALRDAEAGLARGGSTAARREQLRALRTEALSRLGDPEVTAPSNSGG
ncbi:MAG: hypothetical protein JNM72_14610 [Deltaproteobacteria bacterium]|nr:hypothetical protein [Deltaproteobacteria bacterium]